MKNNMLVEKKFPWCGLHEFFVKNAKMNPDLVAILSSRGSLAYNSLLVNSSNIEESLRKFGVKPNALVGVLLGKGENQIGACLGILQSGAAYLPFNVGWPPLRIQNVAKRGDIKIIITERKVLNNIKNIDVFRSCEIILIEEITDNSRLDYQSCAQNINNIAYVIFTSGSTGIPKGVAISHFGAINTVLDINERFCISQFDRVFALSDLSFDLSVYDIFGMLAAGAAIVFPDCDKIKNPRHWIDMLIKHKVSIWNTVPMFMQMLVEYINQLPEDIRSEINDRLKSTLRLVLLSGDWVPLDLPGKINNIFPNAQVISLGGATEGSIWSIIYPIVKTNPDWKSIPYGKALTNQKMYVLDNSMKECRVGITGEIYIGGVGIALGYWKDEIKTKKSFVCHSSFGRLYKTGDLGKYLSDGNIEFLGRKDNQVKLQGFRVELEEIEFVLRKKCDFKKAYVVKRGENVCNTCLIAFVIEKDGKKRAFKEVEILDTLKEHLPVYMVPSRIFCVDSIPLSENGKVDLQKLLNDFDNEKESKKPEVNRNDNKVVVFVKSVLFKVLNISSVDMDLDFYAIGGNSLSAMQICAEINNYFGINIGLEELLGNTRLHDFIEKINALTSSNLI